MPVATKPKEVYGFKIKHLKNYRIEITKILLHPNFTYNSLTYMVEDCSLIPICPVNDPLLLLSLRPISSSYLILWFFLPISPLIPVPPLCIMPGPALLPFASLSHAALPQGVGVGGSVANTEQNLSQNMVARDVLCGWKEQLEQIRYYLASQD